VLSRPPTWEWRRKRSAERRRLPPQLRPRNPLFDWMVIKRRHFNWPWRVDHQGSKEACFFFSARFHREIRHPALTTCRQQPAACCPTCLQKITVRLSTATMALLILTSCAFPSFTLSFEVQPVLPSSQHTTPISSDEPPLAGTEPEYLHLPPPHLAWPLRVHKTR